MLFQHLRLLSARSACVTVPKFVMACHTPTCPTTAKKDVCVAQKTDQRAACAAPGPGGGGVTFTPLVRQQPGKVRLGFVPDEWFLFLYPKTGVTGLYVLGIVLTNYLVSKEMYVLEHEYYSGLSIALMVIFVAVKFGPSIGKALDKQVDEFAAGWENERLREIEHYKKVISESELAQKRAEGQSLLMCAKKENVLMQLEAAYRERFMNAYNAVRGRMDFQVKLHAAEARVQQKWMIQWILDNVMRSITPELQQQALVSAISQLEAVASRGASK